jgi:hypothetical protein
VYEEQPFTPDDLPGYAACDLANGQQSFDSSQAPNYHHLVEIHTARLHLLEIQACAGSGCLCLVVCW